jgi:predicted transposase YbfD/YdcC
VKENQPTLHEDIAGYVQEDRLRETMDTHSVCEKNSGRVERRTAYTTCGIEWLSGREEWERLACIGAIHTHVSSKKGETDEWHYYICSRRLTAAELLRHARLEWSVESMHWLLDAHFREDFCRVEDKNVQRNLNMARKIALNVVKSYKTRTDCKRPISQLMFDCLFDSENILPMLVITPKT